MSLDSEVALFFKGSMSIQDHRDSTSLKTWGSDAARIEEATALFVLYFTERWDGRREPRRATQHTIDAM
jgi:hypothetical protein